MGKLAAGEVDESQIIEPGGDGGVVLDEWVSAGVRGQQFVDGGVVAQHAAVGTERDATQVTPRHRGAALTLTPWEHGDTVFYFLHELSLCQCVCERECVCMCVCVITPQWPMSVLV